MTVYYTQAQIDEIGTLIGQEILNNSEALKVFVQEKINALEPATPAEPEAGGGTAPAPAAGTFLDDGREIKTKLITGTLTGQVVTIPHGIEVSKIINFEVNIYKESSMVVGYMAGSASTSSAAGQFSSMILGNDLRVQAVQADNNILGSKISCLITYLA